MQIYLDNSNNFANFVAWIGDIGRASDKGKLTAFPHYKNCQQKLKHVSNMLKFEELPEVNSERWLSLEDLPGEIWKPVIGYEKCFVVSNYSRIKSLPRLTRKEERIIKPYIGPTGYYEINIFLYGKRVHKKVHRILMEAFVPNPENKDTIDHIDTNTLNNSLDNLRWATYKENTNNTKSLPRILNALERAHSIWKRAVVQKDLEGNIIRVFDSAKEASVITGIDKNSIGQCARKRVGYSKEGWLSRNLTAGGYKWDFLNE